MRKKGTKKKNYSPEYILSVILDMRENHLGYRETVRKYWKTTTESGTSNHLHQVRDWERKYLEEGKDILNGLNFYICCGNSLSCLLISNLCHKVCCNYNYVAAQKKHKRTSARGGEYALVLFLYRFT